MLCCAIHECTHEDNGSLRPNRCRGVWSETVVCLKTNYRLKTSVCQWVQIFGSKALKKTRTVNDQLKNTQIKDFSNAGRLAIVVKSTIVWLRFHSVSILLLLACSYVFSLFLPINRRFRLVSRNTKTFVKKLSTFHCRCLLYVVCSNNALLFFSKVRS